ncbi:hypothetical protein M9458_025841, partial [Cirrhinus mrigala]
VRTRLSCTFKLGAVEKQIHKLLGRQTELRERKVALESSWVSIQHDSNTPTTSAPCASLHRSRAPWTRSSQVSFTPAPGHHGPWVQQQRKTRARPRPRTSPPPPPLVFEISTRNRFAPRDGTRCCDHRRLHCPIPAILKDGESVGAIVLHAGVNNTKLRQMEVLKRDFSSLIQTVRSTSPATRIIVSGPLPTYRRGHE